MRIALINIPDHGISGKGYSAQLGLAYIGAVLRNTRFQLKGFDLSASKKCIINYYLQEDKAFLDSLCTFKPDFIGMTCTTTNRINLNFWAETFKKYLHAFLTESYLKTYPSVDVLIIGGGELTIIDYIIPKLNTESLSTEGFMR